MFWGFCGDILALDFGVHTRRHGFGRFSLFSTELPLCSPANIYLVGILHMWAAGLLDTHRALPPLTPDPAETASQSETPQELPTFVSGNGFEPAGRPRRRRLR